MTANSQSSEAITNGSAKDAVPADVKATSEEKSVDREPNSVDEGKDGNEEPAVPAGSVSEVKNIYRSPKDSDGNWTWVDKYPEDVEDAAENEETEKFAVVVRNIKSQDSRKKLEADSIVVQSAWLKKALGVILKDYPGIACELKRLEFSAPFAPFVHRWAEFVEYMQRKDLDPTEKEHLDILHGILKYEIGDSIKAFEDYVVNGVITFKHLWMIFQPGSVVLGALRGPLSAFELDEAEYMANQCGNFLRIHCDCVDFGGKEFGRHKEKIDIPEFLGIKKITSLNAFPWAFHEDKVAVSASLIKRGELFEKLAGHQYKA